MARRRYLLPDVMSESVCGASVCTAKSTLSLLRLLIPSRSELDLGSTQRSWGLVGLSTRVEVEMECAVGLWGAIRWPMGSGARLLRARWDTMGLRGFWRSKMPVRDGDRNRSISCRVE